MKMLDPNMLRQFLMNRAEQLISLNEISCSAAIVRQCGEVMCTLYAGYSDAASQTPLQPRTMFRLASMTKPVTAVASLIAVHKGYFQLDDHVADFLPAFKNIKIGRLDPELGPQQDRAPKTALKLRQLLNHSSGIMAADALGQYQEDHMPSQYRRDLAQVAAFAAEHTYLSFEPATDNQYSGYAAFDTMARVIELTSSMSYAQFVQQHIFDPLGLQDLTFNPTAEQWSRMCTMHDKAVNGMVSVDLGRHTFERFPLSYTCGGASLAGTLEDYSVFAEMLLRGGSYNQTCILPPVLVQEISRVDLASMSDQWGLGVRVVCQGGTLPPGAFGWSGAYGTHFWVDPINQITAVYMKNMRWHDSHGCGMTGVQFEQDVMAALR